MTVHKTSTLTGVALDAAVLLALGVSNDPCQATANNRRFGYVDKYRLRGCKFKDAVKIFDYYTGDSFRPQNDWQLVGEIIDHECISILGNPDADCLTDVWTAYRRGSPDSTQTGPTARIAALRCLVAIKLGGQVNIPAKLNG